MNREQGSHNLIAQTWGTFCAKSKLCQIPATNRTTKEKKKLGFITIECIAILSSGKK